MLCWPSARHLGPPSYLVAWWEFQVETCSLLYLIDIVADGHLRCRFVDNQITTEEVCGALSD